MGASSPVGTGLDTDDGESRALCNPGPTYPTLSATQVRRSDSDHTEAQCRRAHKLRSVGYRSYKVEITPSTKLGACGSSVAQSERVHEQRHVRYMLSVQPGLHIATKTRFLNFAQLPQGRCEDTFLLFSSMHAILARSYPHRTRLCSWARCVMQLGLHVCPAVQL